MLQCLLVSDADAADHRSAAFFLSRALAPSAKAAPGLRVIQRYSQDTDRGVLETADLFLLVAPAAPSGEAMEIITRRVQEGARYIAVLDGATGPLLVPAAFNPPLELQRMTASDTTDSILAGSSKLFSESDEADWSALRFRRHYRNRILEGRAGEVLLSYPDGSAAPLTNVCRMNPTPPNKR